MPLESMGSQKRNSGWFSLDFLLPYLLGYSPLHYFNISTNVKVSSFQWYQLYAYPGVRAWANRQFTLGTSARRKLRKKEEVLKKFEEVLKVHVQWWIMQHLLGKLNVFIFVAKHVQGYLQMYQTHSPMVPFMTANWIDSLTNVMSRPTWKVLLNYYTTTICALVTM